MDRVRCGRRSRDALEFKLVRKHDLSGSGGSLNGAASFDKGDEVSVRITVDDGDDIGNADIGQNSRREYCTHGAWCYF